MYCCSNCFWDAELKSYIITNSNGIGDCDFCQSKNTEVLNTLELSDYFQTVVSVYQECNNVMKSENGLFLHQRIVADWPNLFRIVNIDVIKKLLASVLSQEVDSIMFNAAVEVKYDTDNSQEEYWDKFVEEIKYQNRFFITNTVVA